MGSAYRGAAVIGQSGGPTNVINQSLIGALLEASKYPEITHFYGSLNGVDGILKENFINLRAESLDNLEVIARTPSSALRSVRKKPTEDECHLIFENFRKHAVRYFFYVGGNDSAETAHIINEFAKDAQYEFHAFHIPKTIDNDLRETDHCPGYGSAARFVAMAFQGANLDNLSLPGVYIGVVMGRHAGFLTAASVLGKTQKDDGPHLVYVPETDFDTDQFVADVEKVYKKYNRCVVAISEGVHDKSGTPTVQTLVGKVEKDSHGNVQLSGIGALGDRLAELVKDRLKISRVRSDTFGYLQRCFPTIISETDAVEARRVGEEAVRAAVRGQYEGSVAIRRLGNDPYRVDYEIVELNKVAKATVAMPRDFLDGTNWITEKFVEYALPLVGDLPELGRLANVSIVKVRK
ncbi:MAG TPA: 6-phosphofructokinase [Candidatus Glassbacteria bacterium]|nr:6-phosphofructokinase [Candidatus Glassbacteria bacterium]